MLDSNKDGVIDRAEFTTTDRQKKADVNGDGTLSHDEITKMVKKARTERRIERVTRRLDVNQDGTVTLAEVKKQKAKRFAVMDRNDDGKIENAELLRELPGQASWLKPPVLPANQPCSPPDNAASLTFCKPRR
jgi:Ca2+-binding EF-hand superfamily protein